MEERLIEVTDASIERILNEGLNTNNLDHLQKLTKVRHMAKEDKEMMNNYGNYNGRGPGYNTYGNYGNYGARGYDMRYRGNEHIERMRNEYGRYEDNKQRYGANEDTKRSLQYMLKSMEDFARMLKEEAQSQEEVQMIRETAQRIANM